jgi:hypothetical protein
VVVLAVVLVVTNLLTLGALAYVALRPAPHPRPDEAVARVLDQRPPIASSSATRRVISVEVLNPIELAATRGRMAGLAGSLAPGLIRRVVYDQTLKTMRRQLSEEGVAADVRLHVLRPPDRPEPPGALPGARPVASPTVAPQEAAEPSAGGERGGPLPGA